MMTKYRTTARLGSSDAAYIAGLIDGEGTVTLTRRHAGENRQLVVSISSTERNMLEFVFERVGAGKITRKRVTSSRHTPSFTYAIHNRQALDLLKQVAPHLRSYKRRRALCVSEHYVRLTPRNGRYTAELAAERRDFEHKLLALKNRM